MKLGVQVGLGPGHIVLDWNPAPLPRRGTASQFSAHICCGQMAGSNTMPLDRKAGLDQSDIVLDGDPAPPPSKRGQSPQFSAHVYCGQTTGWIKMPLGTEVGLSPGNIVLDADPAPQPSANFWPMSVVATLSYMGTQLLTLKRGTAPPLFRLMSIVAKWSPISTTAEHLFMQCISNYGCDKQEGDKFKLL